MICLRESLLAGIKSKKLVDILLKNKATCMNSPRKQASNFCGCILLKDFNANMADTGLLEE